MDFVSIVSVILVFALVGFLVYLITNFIPMPAPFQQVIIVACVVLLVLYLLGFITGHVALPRVH